MSLSAREAGRAILLGSAARRVRALLTRKGKRQPCLSRMLSPMPVSAGAFTKGLPTPLPTHCKSRLLISRLISGARTGNRAVFVAIIERRSITRDALRRLFRLTAAALDVIVNRLVATGDIEQNWRFRMRPLKEDHGRQARGSCFSGATLAVVFVFYWKLCALVEQACG